MGTSGIVAACILQAAGAGYSFKLLKTDKVAVAFFGDGAVNNGKTKVPTIMLKPVLVTKENIKTTVVQDGFQALKSINQALSADQQIK